MGYAAIGNSLSQGIQGFIAGQTAGADRKYKQQLARQMSLNNDFTENTQQTREDMLKAQFNQIQDELNQDRVRQVIASVKLGDIDKANFYLQKYPQVREMLGNTSTIKRNEAGELSVLKTINGMAQEEPMNMQAIDILSISSGAEHFLGVQKKQTAEAQLAGNANTAYIQKLDEYLQNNPDATPTDIRQFLGEQNKSTTPFSIQEAQYFGALKTKIEEGEATDEELNEYKAYLISRGGTSSAQIENIGAAQANLKSKGIDLASPSFNIESLDEKDIMEAETVIRQLENTTSGRKLVANIGKMVGDGVGAVRATANTLAALANDANINTGIVLAQMEAISQYVPESLRNVTEEDLKDTQYAQAYASVVATFLKLQSGLTVNEAEVKRFDASMGTLSKNQKVQMSGLKGKIDEVIGTYEENKTLEPTLYNAKYRRGIEALKGVSNSLGKFLEKPNEKKKPSRVGAEGLGSVEMPYEVTADTIYKPGKHYKTDDGEIYKFKGGDFKVKENWELIK
jgi:hypothetical protein